MTRYPQFIQEQVLRKTFSFDLINRLIDVHSHLIETILSFVAATDVLMLSMTCKQMRTLIDGSHHLLANLLAQQYPMMNNMLRVSEYDHEINIHVCAATIPTNTLFAGALTCTVGEEFVFDVNVVNTTPKLISAIPTQQYHLHQWKVINVYYRDGRALLHAHYKWATVILRCIDPCYTLSKPMYMRLTSVLMYHKPISSRSLLATRIHRKCMSCGYRDGIWISYACAVPSCRRLCQFCSNDRMIAEWALRAKWKVQHSDIVQLRQFAFRYHSSKHNSRYIKTLIPRAVVLSHFNMPTWPAFIALTAKRASSHKKQSLINI